MSLGDDLLLASASYGNENAINDLNKINNELESYLKILLNNGYEFLIVKSAGNTNGYPYLKVDYNKDDKENTRYGYVPYTTNKDSDEYKKYSYLYPNDDSELMARLAQGNCDAQYDVFSGIKDEEIKSRIIVVGATENKGNNQYKLSEQYSVCGSRVDILAPGTNLGVITYKNKYTTGISGTSFSAPHVTGVAGLVLSMKPTIPGDMLKEILVQNGKGEYKTYITRHDDRSKDECNYSMVDALETVKSAENEYEKNNVTSVKFTLNTIEEDNVVLESAVIDGLDEQNQVVWTYETEKYECTELDRVNEIGINNNKYYFVEDGIIVALNLSDGSLLWKNEDFGGANVHFDFDANGNLYICGYYGPDLFIVNQEGQTIHKISVIDNQYCWPFNIKYDNNKVYITYDNTPSGSEAKCIVDLNDYGYSFENDNTLSNEQLDEIRRQLGVPDDLEIIIKQYGPYYWEAGETWYMQVSIEYNGEKIAGADVDISNGELLKTIYTY